MENALPFNFGTRLVKNGKLRSSLFRDELFSSIRFRSIAKSYFRRCDGVILVYDSTYERSFLNVREWIDTINESAPKKVSVMIIANKIDLREQLRGEGKRVIEHSDGAKLAKVGDLSIVDEHQWASLSLRSIKRCSSRPVPKMERTRMKHWSS